VLFRVDFLKEAVFVVAVLDGHDRLEDYRPRIHAFVDEMHRASRELHPRLYRLPRGVDARERRQESRMEVYHSVGIRPHQNRREDSHEPGQNYELYTQGLQML